MLTKRAKHNDTYLVSYIIGNRRYDQRLVPAFEIPTWPIVKTWDGEYDVNTPPITPTNPGDAGRMEMMRALHTLVSHIINNGEVYHNDMAANREKVYTWLWALSKSSIIKIPHDVAVLIGKRLLHTRPILKQPQ